MSNRDRLAGIVLPGLVSLIVGGVGVVVNDYIKTSSVKLEYDVISNSSFVGETQKVAMVAIEILNSGKKELEVVAARVQWKGAELVEAKTEGFPTKGLTQTKAKDQYLMEVPFLNPSEGGRILLLLTLIGTEFAQPTVELRGKGIAGTPRVKSSKSKTIDIVLIPFTAFTAAFMSLLALRLRGDKGFTTSHRDDQRDVAAYILDLNGLSGDAQTLRHLPRAMSYWSLADSLTQAALSKGEPDYMRKVAQSLENIMEYAEVVDTSCFLLHYNLARLYNRLGETDKAKAALELARKENHKVIDKRISLTPDLKLLASIELAQKNR